MNAVIDPGLRVVGVGSSAGGLGALGRLLGNARREAPWCFVVAQHMSPSHASKLVELLSRETDLEVVAAEEGQPVQRGFVYVASPGTDIVVQNGTIGLPEADDARRPWPSIDRLMTSLAESYDSQAVGIILSGTGDDGASGVEALRSHGGIVAIQEPSTADYGEMPQAAFSTGMVDLSLPSESIAAELELLLFEPVEPPREGLELSSVTESAVAEGVSSELSQDNLQSIVDIVHRVLGIDFSGYKRSTLNRQVERRQRINNVSEVDYLALLAQDPKEPDALARAVLVSVTAFFRDSPVWDAVRSQLRILLEDSEAGSTVRLWVPGCASGEEAYTLAMLAAETITDFGGAKSGLASRLKVFATDLDETALGIARLGHYSDAAVSAVPEVLRDRWMYRTGTGWAIVSELRECMVIARHNVAFDPPFPRVNFISLRNNLIYFEPHLQERVLQLCHYALLPGGSIVLGMSERVPRIDIMFTVVDYPHRIYRRGDSARTPSLAVARYFQPHTSSGVGSAGTLVAPRDTPGIPYRQILQVVSPPTLILDDRDLLVEVIGDVTPWCGVLQGRQTGAVSEILKEPYRATVRTMIGQLHYGGATEVQRIVAGQQEPVHITVTAISGDSAARSVVSFRAVDAPRADTTVSVDSGSVLEISAELDTAQRALQSIVEDLGTSNEELQAMNEELQASSEELQATTEEAQAANEELEATNEELTTLNQELQARTTEALRVNTDLVTIQMSLTSGLVIVDRELRVTRFTPLAVRLFSLIDEDHGRPLTSIPTTLPIATLAGDLRATLDQRQPSMRELRSDSKDYLLQTQPYLGADDAVQGVIVVVTDVTDISSARRARDDALRNLHVVADSNRELVWQRDTSGNLTFINSQVEKIYGLAHDQVMSDPTLLYSAVHPDDRERVARITAAAQRNWQFQYRIVRPDGSIRWIDEAAHALSGDNSPDALVIGSAVDITDRHHLETDSAERTAVLDALLGTVTAGVVVLDEAGRIIRASAGFAHIAGYEERALVGTPLSMLLDRHFADEYNETGAHPAFPDRGTVDNCRLIDVRGSARPVSIEFHPVDQTRSSGPGPASVAVVHDISRMREISNDLASREQFDQHTGLLTRKFFRTSTAELIAGSTNHVAALWMDLDGFKETNDRFGHRAGDTVLATIATRLQRATRRHDIMGRLGGDEFAILVTRSEDLDGLELLAHRILAAVREPIALPDSLVYVTASVGIAVHPDDGRTADELLHNADTAMYAAKTRGGDRHMYFAPGMNNMADERALIHHRLAEAIRNSDFELYYQPIIDVQTARIAMVETLLRWRRDDEIVPAAEFIEHAIETGQMRALGKIMLTLLDEDLRVLQEKLGSARPRVSLNLSGTELDERDIIDRLIGWSPAGGFDKLVIEVTESVLLDDNGRARDTLGALQRFGASISIDDFGTGYSNLDLLNSLEPSIIKIDRSLLRRAPVNDRGANILKAAVHLARALDAAVIVEGVENENDWERVQDLGVDMAQGYHLGRPMPLSDLIGQLATNKP